MRHGSVGPRPLHVRPGLLVDPCSHEAGQWCTQTQKSIGLKKTTETYVITLKKIMNKVQLNYFPRGCLVWLHVSCPCSKYGTSLQFWCHSRELCMSFDIAVHKKKAKKQTVVPPIFFSCGCGESAEKAAGQWYVGVNGTWSQTWWPPDSGEWGSEGVDPVDIKRRRYKG